MADVGNAIPFGNQTNAVARLLERNETLDRIADPASRWVRNQVQGLQVKDLLSGSWLGHPVHPPLTDLPIGFWTSAFVLDFVGGKAGRRAAQRLVALGLLSAIPTAITGAADWSDTEARDRRVGVVHGLLNVAALGAYAVSWRARHRGRHYRGVTAGLVGAGFASAAAFLGGHLVDTRGVGVSHIAFESGPDEWVPVCQLLDVTEEPLRATANAQPIVVTRVGDEIVAVAATCPHRGAPLDEGTIENGTITCPWHASCFRLDDGALLRGPATVPLDRYDARVRDGTVEVRRSA